ncbi:hypothetical protein Pelo_17202 [Pelomyxa schiedti]|nr:hypothetical protein Pelo_17202 [Pelomyxa schiedti]
MLHNTSTLPSHKAEDVEHIVAVSKIIWEWVVVPGWLTAPPNGGPCIVDRCEQARGGASSRDEARAVALYRVGSGLFPLVARACATVAETVPRGSRYFRLRCAAWAGATTCARWIVSHLCWNDGDGYIMGRKKKACVNILTGLLCGGHVDLAIKFVNSTEIVPTVRDGSVQSGVQHGAQPTMRTPVGELGVKWPGAPGSLEDAGMKEDIKGNDWFQRLLCSCTNTPVESVKWVVGWLGLRQPWELIHMVRTAMYAGNAPVVQWLVTTFNLAEVFNRRSADFLFIATHCAEGRCPSLLKWWIESFSFPQGGDKDDTFRTLVCNEFSSVELCQWLKSQLGILGRVPYFPQTPQNPQCLRWAIEDSKSPISDALLGKICSNSSDLEVVKWLVTEKFIKPTNWTFLMACSSRKENLELVRWLSQKMTLSHLDLQKALEQALSNSNIGIADWLDNTYNVVSSKAPGVCPTLVKIWRNLASCPSLAGLKWLVRYTNKPQAPVIPAEEIICRIWDPDLLFFLLEAFHISVQRESKLLRHLLTSIFMRGTMSDIRRLRSMVPVSVDDVKQSITPPLLKVESSKISKWIVSQVGVEHMKTEKLYSRLFHLSKTQCATWLIDTFHIPLSEVIDDYHPVYSLLSTWKLLANKFPSLESDTVRREYMDLVVSTPAIAEWSMERFSLTFSEIATYCGMRQESWTECATRLWLSLVESSVANQSVSKRPRVHHSH